VGDGLRSEGTHDRSDIHLVNNLAQWPGYEKMCGEESGVEQVISGDKVEPEMIPKKGLAYV